MSDAIPQSRIPIARLPDGAPAQGNETQTRDPIVTAILHEIADKLHGLSSRAECSSIDLRWLAASRPQLEKLRGALGTGEVSAEVNAVGRSRISETAVPCVWWVSHFDGNDHLRGEFIEITEAPDLLRADRLCIPAGLKALRELCAAAAANDLDHHASDGRSRA